MRKGGQKEEKLSPSPCLAASAEPRLQTLLMRSGQGLGSLPAESSVHAGRIILNKAPFFGSASWGVLAAAFVAAARSPLSSRHWEAALRLPWEQPPPPEVAHLLRLFGQEKLRWWWFWPQGNKTSGRGRGWCGGTQQWCFCPTWKRSRQDWGGAAWRSGGLC